MSMARVQDKAFEPLRKTLQRLKGQAEPAYRGALLDTTQHLADRVNDSLEEKGLGRPVSTWVHRGRLQFGVPEGHPDTDALWDHEYGTLTSSPQATLRSTLVRNTHQSGAHFNEQFHRGFLRGTMWER